MGNSEESSFYHGEARDQGETDETREILWIQREGF